MLNDNRQQYVIQTNDTKGDEGFGKFFGAVIVLVMFLGLVQMAFDTITVWYRDTMAWVDDTATYLGSFWPF
ncbi:hypothetical protein [Ensifer adhaerens]|uniref:hypothetical protein n=1 Tax=Ensifer adhaerens TaxID=106592 RepID=UPI000CF115DF|nr:hypothetical protein [Ensifer adhaerens]